MATTIPIPRKQVDDNLLHILEDIAEDLKCSLCLEYFQHPVTLQCLHTYCLSCLKDHLNKGGGLCPLCNAQIQLGKSGVDGLMKNFQMMGLVEKIRSIKSRKCENCQNNIASKNCKQCSNFLCTKCVEQRHSHKIFKQHTPQDITLEESDPLNETKELAVKDENSFTFDDDAFINYDLDRNKCTEAFQEWVKSLWFLPPDFSTLKIKQLKPIYLPFWLMELQSHVKYQASIEKRVFGKDSRPTYFTTTGTDTNTNMIAVCATDYFDSSYLEKIEPWKFEFVLSIEDESKGKFVFGKTYRNLCSPCPDDSNTTKIPHGTQVMPFVYDDQQAFVKGKVYSWLCEVNKAACEQKIKHKLSSSEQIRNVFLETNITRAAAQRIFLPSYIIRYAYKDIEYIAIVNGQSGHVHGERPYSIGKVGLLKNFFFK
eukprot:TRINITY_DN851_c0_g1_i3.p1 TRINITY_DN851_c0_g1~~TRINITY_DN851_c0_g1_i3.p1  ORF type:complete len:426 (-),score=64.62 TRINITY_DN851_c0_g1_i3:209-1486(-)